MGRCHYAGHDRLRSHLTDFVAAHNDARRLKTPRGLTPFEFIVKCWRKSPNASGSIQPTTRRD